MTTCVGLEAQNPIVYQQNGSYRYDTIGPWIDKLFTDNASNVATVDSNGAVKKLTMRDDTLTIWATDQVGLPQEKKILSVQRTELSKLPAGVKNLLFMATNNGTSVIVGADTPIVTRVNNQVGSVAARDLDVDNPVGCMWGCNLWSYVIKPSGPQPIQYAVQSYMQVPDIITATWGELLLNRGNCADLIDICDNYPDSVDPGDRAVFDAALTEMLQYDPIHTINPDATNYFKGQYLYWIETEWGNFQSYMNSFFVGEPHISPLSKPSLPKLSRDDKKVGDVNEVHKVIDDYKQKKVDSLKAQQ